MADQSKLTQVAMILIPVGLGYLAYSGTLLDSVGVQGLEQRKARVVAVEDSIKTVEAQTDSAKRELARGTVDELRKRLEGYRTSLALLRQLVPDRNEVPNLLDDISTRAKIRGVNLAQVTPMPVENGPAPFDTHRYTMSVIGRYDEIGEFMADIATLQRIIVPQDVQLAAAPQNAAKALGDTTGSLLEAKFQIRTFVKATQAEGESSGT